MSDETVGTPTELAVRLRNFADELDRVGADIEIPLSMVVDIQPLGHPRILASREVVDLLGQALLGRPGRAEGTLYVASGEVGEPGVMVAVLGDPPQAT